MGPRRKGAIGWRGAKARTQIVIGHAGCRSRNMAFLPCHVLEGHCSFLERGGNGDGGEGKPVAVVSVGE